MMAPDSGRSAASSLATPSASEMMPSVPPLLTPAPISLTEMPKFRFCAEPCEARVLIATTSPRSLIKGPPLFPPDSAASTWIQVPLISGRPISAPSSSAERTALIMPVVAVNDSPFGDPNAVTRSPLRGSSAASGRNSKLVPSILAMQMS